MIGWLNMDFHYCNIDDNFKYHKFLNNYSEQIEVHKMLTDNLDGRWFIVNDYNTNILGNYYIGLNELTSLKEFYVNLYIDDLSINDDLDSIISYINKNIDVDQSALDWGYIAVYANEMRLRHRFVTTLRYLQTYELYSVIIEKTIDSLKASGSLPSDLFSIKKATDDYEEDIIHCLERAHINGLNKNMLDLINFDQFTKCVLSYYRPFFNGLRESFVLTVDNKFFGHGSIEFVKYINKNDQYARLIDILILEPFNNTGLSKNIAIEIENYCFTKGIKRITGSIEVEDFNHFLKTYKSLCQSMWKPYSIIYAKRLKGKSNEE